jgi:hypothetical protein
MLRGTNCGPVCSRAILVENDLVRLNEYAVVVDQLGDVVKRIQAPIRSVDLRGLGVDLTR